MIATVAMVGAQVLEHLAADQQQKPMSRLAQELVKRALRRIGFSEIRVWVAADAPHYLLRIEGPRPIPREGLMLAMIRRRPAARALDEGL